MQPRVRIAHGTAFDVVLSAAAVADPAWRDAFEAGPATYAHIRSVAGDDFVRQVAGFGRFGWINLVALRGSESGPWNLPELMDGIRASLPEDLHLVTLGGDRRQLKAVIGEATLRAAVRGDAEARTQLATALRSDDLVIEVSPWLLGAPSGEVRERLLELLRVWHELLLPPAAEDVLATTLRAHAEAAEAVLGACSGRSYLDAAAGGLRYDPAGLDRVLSVSSTQVAPIVVVVDGQAQTTIMHPPPASWHRTADSRARLLQLSRAVGDKTRMQLLTILQGGQRTAVELAQQMRAPRTTLLHHLAILRAAGVVQVTVTPGGATVYRLRPEGFSELSTAAAGFVPRTSGYQPGNEMSKNLDNN